MQKRVLFSALSLALIVACSDDDTVAPPPAPLTPDQQTVASCRAIQDALETYAAAHNGAYGDDGAMPALQSFQNLKNVYSGEPEPSSMRARFAGQIGLETYDCGGNIYGYRITGYGSDHMLVTLESLDNVPADVRYTHDVTVANVLVVMDAAMRFAANNNGVFSTDVAGDMDNDGNTLQDLLPNNGIARLLGNPFTGHATEPQDGIALGTPGAIGYMGSDSGSGNIDQFVVEAYDCDGAIMLTMLPYTAYGEIIWGGTYRLRTAIELFRKAAGHYPHDLDTETTPGGKSVLDFVSEMTDGNVPYFVNWYNQEHYVPTLGTPTGKFTIGYQPIETAGTVTDYVIIGRVANELLRLGPNPLP